MKGLYACLLLSAVLFFLCLSFAVPACAGNDAIQPRPPLQVNAERIRKLNNADNLISRSDRLLLLDNVVSLWKLRVNIGEVKSNDTALPDSFSPVKNGQLSPSFIARTTLQLMVMASNEGIMNFPEAYENEKEKRKLQQLFSGVPEQYRLFVPYTKLESMAQEWLGGSFDKSALPQADYFLQKEKGLFIDDIRLFDSWPLYHQHDAFAEVYNLYPENDIWIMEGCVRGLYQAEDDILRVVKRDMFRMTVKKTDKYWRILSLNFDVK